MTSTWKRVLHWREWSLLGIAIWAAVTLLVLNGLQEVFRAEDLPSAVRNLAVIAMVVVLLVFFFVFTTSLDAWSQRRLRDQKRLKREQH